MDSHVHGSPGSEVRGPRSKELKYQGGISIEQILMPPFLQIPGANDRSYFPAGLINALISAGAAIVTPAPVPTSTAVTVITCS